MCGRNRIRGAVERGEGRGERVGDSKRTAGEDRKGVSVARGRAQQEKVTTFSSQFFIGRVKLQFHPN